MSLKHRTVVYTVILMSLTFHAGTCGDRYTVKLNVFPDGSLDKTIEWTTSQNNPEMEDVLSPLPGNSSWAVTPKGRKSEKTLMGRIREVWIYQARKKFKTVKDHNREYESGGRVSLAPRAEFEKRYRGWFIHYKYRETYPALNLFKNNPASEYFSPEEMKLIEAILEDERGSGIEIPEERKKAIERKSETWMRKTLFREFFSLLLGAASETEGQIPTKEQLLNQKEEIFARYSDFTRDNIFKVSFKDFLTEFAEARNQPSFSMLWSRHQARFIEYQRDLKAMDEAILDLYLHQVRMPGQILSSNAQSVTGNRATWEIPFLILIFRDAVMEVESRRFNWWFPGLGIPILLLLLLGLLTVIRNHRSG